MSATILVILVELLDVPQIFGSVITFEALLQDTTLTNFACLVLVVCDAACIVYGSASRIYHALKKRVASPRKQQSAPNAPAFNPYPRAELTTGELNFNETDINVNTIRIFEKKSN
jgi:hypothetical protein